MAQFPQMMGMRGFPKSRQVTVFIKGGNTNPSISFGEQPDLRYARILGMESFTYDDYTKNAPDGQTSILGAQQAFLSVTLETNDGDEWYENETGANNPNNTGRFRTTSQNIKWQPLATFHRVQNQDADPFVRQLFEFNNIFVTWEKSFINISDVSQFPHDCCVIFQVYYTFRSIYGQMIKRT